MRILIVCILSLVPTWSLAAYQNPLITSNTATPDGGGTIVLQFPGNAGEPTVSRTYVIQQNSTFPLLQEWVDDTIKELNKLWAAKSLPTLQNGQTVTRQARVIPPPTAKQVWLDKFERYKGCSSVTLASTGFNNACSAIKADLEATYQAGFLD